MGKPLSRPDCLRQAPVSCVGKGEEEDLNIDDCYVPQRSIYDTVRLNEQIDCGSKGSLASRHFPGTLPYSHRTLDMASLCGNGALASSSAFELRMRDAARPDQRPDGPKLNGDIIRGAGTVVLPKPCPQEMLKKDQPQHRRSWRAFAPPGGGEYCSRSGTLGNEGPLSWGRRGRSVTNSLTSEEDSGLCSPTAERERRAHRAHQRPGPGTRSLSSSDAMHASGEIRPGRSLSSGQEDFPFSPIREAKPRGHGDSAHHLLVADPSEAELTSPTNGGRSSSTGRLSSRSGSRSHNGVSVRRSRTLASYDELPTAELMEGPSLEDCELVSVLVTQPQAYERSFPPPRADAGAGELQSRRPQPRYSMEDLEDFLQAVERQACLANGSQSRPYQHMGDEEIESLLTAIAACPDMDLIELSPPQVAKNSLSVEISGGFFL